MPVKKVRNLGVWLDNDLQLDSQVNKTVTTCLSLLRMLRKILLLLPTSARSEVVRSTILSRLDYCNALLLEAPVSLLQKLQRIQNMAAKMALNGPRTASSSATLRELHWLPWPKECTLEHSVSFSKQHTILVHYHFVRSLYGTPLLGLCAPLLPIRSVFH